MNKILAITGATGKKSGGYFTKVLCEPHTFPIIDSTDTFGYMSISLKTSMAEEGVVFLWDKSL